MKKSIWKSEDIKSGSTCPWTSGVTLTQCIVNKGLILDHVGSATVLAISLLGRRFARKNGQPAGLFSINIILVPLFYFASFKLKHVDQIFSNYRARPTFNECLEFYPVTRRAWKRALFIRSQEMTEIKSKVGDLN